MHTKSKNQRYKTKTKLTQTTECHLISQLIPGNEAKNLLVIPASIRFFIVMFIGVDPQGWVTKLDYW